LPKSVPDEVLEFNLISVAAGYWAFPLGHGNAGCHAAQEGETVEVSALTAYLKKIGLTQHRRYAACTLGRMARYGLVARARRGLYRINRYHPELMVIRRVGRSGPPDAP